MNKIDLLFIVDVTGSMLGFINDAKNRMRGILSSLSSEYNLDLKVGFSCYRDHPSQGDSFVTVTFDLKSVEDIQNILDEIDVGGGGDTPEAVLDGIIDGVESMSWRSDSRRIAFLIGDAPAHGMVNNEDCCQCGKTWGDAVNSAQNHNIPIYSVLLGNDIEAESNFKLLSSFTGGIFVSDNNAMETITTTLKSEFDDIVLDIKILEMLNAGKSEDEIADLLKIDRNKIDYSKAIQ